MCRKPARNGLFSLKQSTNNSPWHLPRMNMNETIRKKRLHLRKTLKCCWDYNEGTLLRAREQSLHEKQTSFIGAKLPDFNIFVRIIPKSSAMGEICKNSSSAQKHRALQITWGWTELEGFLHRPLLMQFEWITGVAFNNKPFPSSWLKIVGRPVLIASPLSVWEQQGQRGVLLQLSACPWPKQNAGLSVFWRSAINSKDSIYFVILSSSPADWQSTM